MKNIKDKNFDHKKVVKDGYNKCSSDYSKVRNKKTEPSLKLLTDKLVDQNAKVLDLGCGNGVPVSKILSKFQLTGVDISEKQIENAKINIPNAHFICSDISTFDFQENYWDAIVSYYAIFHLKKEEQLKLFNKMAKGLKVGGYFLLTLATLNEEGYTEDDFFGVEMFWENYSLKEYENIFLEQGMTVLHSGILKHGYNEDFEGNDETHPIIFGIKTAK
ncbi:class I SAM-dependent methyltransferase [Flammeovirga kamogawensis]|uniref:Class I SAM-dependent methyltransferase n=1 Tax=Flammeovirga kamogawensis TaxID=373891 RepID=A0ABX8GVD9_9BACT|nr:class I SAM-dependent methyltransferase [Flammeovirga kamogawensis]MBB6460983.1 cyclopropane fatty-acyl-phospholipid synthase-like methyltransferase [Flammeovirga kamogawensis]QWG07555.1 class I SAM-dependent methyltransferase [Flammeovirga kamogawensis]